MLKWFAKMRLGDFVRISILQCIPSVYRERKIEAIFCYWPAGCYGIISVLQ
jgi:hypothetical protein